jgi:hypothetical protein
MKRLLAIGLVVTLGNASAAFAEESLLASATRLIASAQISAPAKVDAAAAKAAAMTSFAKAAGVREGATLAQQGGSGTISQSGLSKRTKALILSGVAASFVGIAYGIDHRVRDVTPSSLGTREDNSVFGK